jgi:hypothetical protein
VTLPAETSAPAAPSAGSGDDAVPEGVQSPVAAPGCALDMLEYVLKTKGARFPEEIGVNVCLLLGQVARAATRDAPRREAFVREARALLEAEVKGAGEGHAKLKAAAEQALATITQSG